MKVSIIHPERRTVQSIQLGADNLLKKLRPTMRHDLVIPRGGVFEFIASVGHKKFGPVSLVIELQAEEGETIKPGCVCYTRIMVKATEEKPPVFEQPPPAGHLFEVDRCTVRIDIVDEIGIVIANPTEPDATVL
jgi:hypothetical protein